MNTDDDLGNFFEEPKYETSARDFIGCAWDLNTKFNTRSIFIRMNASNDFLDATTDFIERIQSYSDETGFVPISQTLGWNIHELQAEEDAKDIFSAHNFRVSASINVEREGVTEIELYVWQAISESFAEVCKHAIEANGLLESEISARVYRRSDRTVCVQIFFSFLFNEEINEKNMKTNLPSFDINEAELRFAQLVSELKDYDDSGRYKEYLVNISSPEDF